MIELRSPSQIEQMRPAGRFVAEVLTHLSDVVDVGTNLLEIDEIMARIDAVSLEDLRSLVEELWVPEALSAAGIGPDEAAFTEAVAPVCPAAEPLAA